MSLSVIPALGRFSPVSENGVPKHVISLLQITEKYSTVYYWYTYIDYGGAPCTCIIL